MLRITSAKMTNWIVRRALLTFIASIAMLLPTLPVLAADKQKDEDKLANLKAPVALHFAYSNFCRVHSALRVTPAMEAGLTDHVWSISELLFLQHAV
jgi:hypothetical protein